MYVIKRDNKYYHESGVWKDINEATVFYLQEVSQKLMTLSIYYQFLEIVKVEISTEYKTTEINSQVVIQYEINNIYYYYNGLSFVSSIHQAKYFENINSAVVCLVKCLSNLVHPDKIKIIPVTKLHTIKEIKESHEKINS